MTSFGYTRYLIIALETPLTAFEHSKLEV